MLSITLRDDELGGYMLPHAEVHNCSLHTYTQRHTQEGRTGVKREEIPSGGIVRALEVSSLQ